MACIRDIEPQFELMVGGAALGPLVARIRPSPFNNEDFKLAVDSATGFLSSVGLTVYLAYDGTRVCGGERKIVCNRLPDAWKEEPRIGSPYDFAVLKIADAAVGIHIGGGDASTGNVATRINDVAHAMFKAHECW